MGASTSVIKQSARKRPRIGVTVSRSGIAGLAALFAGFIAVACAALPVVPSERATAASRTDTLDGGLRPGPGVTATRRLSDYGPGLAGTVGDAAVYVLDSGKPGATLVVIGGTHANEPAGMVAAAMIVERAVPERGRLVVVPFLNLSGLGYADPANPRPLELELEATTGTRAIRYGARLVHPDDQGAPDPERYVLPDSEESLPGVEARNLNRAYPGAPDGTLTQRAAFAVMELLRKENAGLAVDMHEARPTSKLIWMIVANPKNIDQAIEALFDLDERGIPMKLDQSSPEFRGLSHREWGDRTEAMAFLVETVNPAQDPKAGAIDQLGHPEFPLKRRVGVQLEALAAIIRAYNASEASATRGAIEYGGLPGLDELMANGLEAYF